ncbi:MAG: hypothetical protein PHX21_11160 [bacterium]|nr:hypothetical protein [bacterium]
MNIKIAEISQELWNKLDEAKSTNKDPFVFNSENNKDWLFKICGIYDKGKIQLLLCSIPKPGTPYAKLQPLTDSDWQSAFIKANQLLFDLCKLSIGNSSVSGEWEDSL